jgi:hypothetical protein
MKRGRLLGVVFIAMLALAAMTATTALAAATLPSLLPEGTIASPITWASNSGKSALGFPGLGEVSAESLKLGKFHVHFSGIKNALLGTCTGTGEEAGVVLVLGTYHFRWYTLSPPHLTGLIFLIEQVQFACGSTQLTVAGCVGGLISPEAERTSLLEAALATANGDNTVITVLDEENTAQEACQLLAKIAAGVTELAAFQTTQLGSEFKQNGKAVEIEVMPV